MIAATRMGDPRADVGRSHGERRLIAGVPVVLVARVQDVYEIGTYLGANQRAAIHHLGHVLESLTNLDVIHRRINRRKRTQHLVALETFFERRISFGIKRLRGRHAAGHPTQDHGVCRGIELRLFLGQGGQGRQRRGRRRCLLKIRGD